MIGIHSLPSSALTRQLGITQHFGPFDDRVFDTIHVPLFIPGALPFTYFQEFSGIMVSLSGLNIPITTSSLFNFSDPGDIFLLVGPTAPGASISVKVRASSKTVSDPIPCKGAESWNSSGVAFSSTSSLSSDKASISSNFLFTSSIVYLVNSAGTNSSLTEVPLSDGNFSVITWLLTDTSAPPSLPIMTMFPRVIQSIPRTRGYTISLNTATLGSHTSFP